ncbi:MAG: ABC transporter permease [Lachnospiraceae bacterium]|nr:ABC transporter permease [Lachnospiraceae bacterium]
MRLLKLEIKRVIKTRLTVILLLVAFGLTLLLAWLPTTFPGLSYLDENGNYVELTGREATLYEKQVQASIAGEVTTDKVRKALEDYQEVLRKYNVETSIELPEGVYGTEILPMEPLLHGLSEAYANRKTGLAPAVMDRDPEKLTDYYAMLEERVESIGRLEQSGHPAAQKAELAAYQKIEKPYQFYPGYNQDAMDYQLLLGFLILCICAVISAPIFTSDYQTGADDILRCTKYGRGRFAWIKILSVLIVTSVTMILCSTLYIFISDSLFGWESTKTSIQMLYSIVSLPNMNVAQFQVFVAVASLLSVLATVCMTLLLSAKCKNIMVSLSGALIFCIIPIVLYMALPQNIGNWIYPLFPASGAGIQTSFLYNAIDFKYLNLGNLAMWLPDAMLIVCIVEIPLFSFLAAHAYIHRKE